MIRTRRRCGMTRLVLVLGFLLLLTPAATVSARPAAAPPRQTSIFYYPWYGTPKWDGSYSHWDQNGHTPPVDLASSYYPARGPYSSRDPRVVAAQMRDIAGAGITEVVSSWWGWGSSEDLLLPMIVRMATKVGLEVAVQIEPYDGRTAQSVASDLVHLRGLGITRVYVYHPFETDEASWAAVLPSVQGMQVLAETGNVARAQAAHFAGIYTYDVVTFGHAALGPLCARAHSAGLVCAPSVGPGYDALRATGDTRVRPRDGGATYDAMWRAAIHSGADRVTITSYNEWHEGTQIEPALTPSPRKLAVAAGPATSPVTEPYSSYEGAYGFHGRQASRAYLIRTGYWTALYRAEPESRSSVRVAGKPAAHGRKAVVGAERGRMLSMADGLRDDLSTGPKGRRHAAFRASGSNLRLGVMPSRLMAAVRVTGSSTVVRPLARTAPRSSRVTREWSCYRARRPHTLLGMSVITRCASSSGDSRSVCTRRTASTTSIGGKLDVRKGGD
jgi:glycoprotein endo-alpha-1,2-mannosidase